MSNPQTPPAGMRAVTKKSALPIYAIGVVGIQSAGQLGADKAAIQAVKQAAEGASYDLGWRPEKNHRG